MYTTPNLNLTAWDRATDFFDFSALATDWQRLDVHNHNSSAGLGLQIGTSGIVALSITTVLVADKAITQAKLADLSVGTAQLQDGSVTNAKLASGGTINGNQITPGSIGFTQLDPNVQPLGTVLLWYRAPGDVRLPGGVWEPLDGRAWNSVPNSLGYSTGNMPDTRNAFPMGAALTGSGNGPYVPPAIGATGGNHTPYFGHAHTVALHNHTQVGHTHITTYNGAHNHTFASNHLHSRGNSFPQGMTVINANTNQQQGNPLQSTYIAGFNSGSGDAVAVMDSTPDHIHGTNAAQVNTDYGGSNTDVGMGYIDTRPQFVGFLFIMRVR